MKYFNQIIIKYKTQEFRLGSYSEFTYEKIIRSIESPFVSKIEFEEGSHVWIYGDSRVHTRIPLEDILMFIGVEGDPHTGKYYVFFNPELPQAHMV